MHVVVVMFDLEASAGTSVSFVAVHSVGKLYLTDEARAMYRINCSVLTILGI